MINSYKICCLEDYDAFCKEKTNFRWICGLPLVDVVMRNAIMSRKFPIYLSIDENGFVTIESSTPKDTIIYSTKEKPISLMTDKRAQGIYFVNEEGKEIFFSIEDFIKSPDKLIYAVEESVSLAVGDIVKVIDAGQGYSTYTSWFEENNVSIDIAARYGFGNNIPANSLRYKIVAVGKHSNYGNIVYAITPTDLHFVTDNTIVYLIGAKGVEKVADKM